MDKPRYAASVRAVVEYALLSGDLTAGGSVRRMREGMRAHMGRQAGLTDAAVETPVHGTVETAHCLLELSGRIDALLERDGVPVVEEIKLAAAPGYDAPLPAHRAQAEMYAYLLGAEEAAVRVVYVSRDGAEVASFERRMTHGALCAAFFSLVLPYIERLERETQWRAVRNASLRALPFPFAAWREEQRKMAVQVYWAIRSRKRLFAQAPTGTGKTAAALYPALKALGEGLTEQVYFLTARTTGQDAALEALARLRQSGMRLHALRLTAKEKICPYAGTENFSCRMDGCPCAKGFFDRLPQALEAMRRCEDWSDAAVLTTASRFSLCPFEFSLCLLEEADAIVCDYNYAFDPAVRIRRALPRAARITFLTDEAHNLPERARDMLSAALDTAWLRAVRRELGKLFGRKTALYRQMTALLKAVEAQRDPISEAPPQDLRLPAEQLLETALSAGEAGAPLCRTLLAFVAALDRFDGSFRTLWQRQAETAVLSLRCLDASGHVAALTKRLSGAAFFSATLAPLPLYRMMLGGSEEDALLALESPFPQENLRVLLCPLSTRYRDRERTAQAVARAVLALCEAKSGNYLICFPSYAYLERIAARLREEMGAQTELICQRENMGAAERDAFLEALRPHAQGTLLALAVLGGAFGESVDLPGGRLSGVVVVGVGMPLVCAEREALKAYCEANGGSGFARAYQAPGMSKVTQAVGRLIRTESDRGIALLIDDRFTSTAYQKMMPPWWGGGTVVRETEQIRRQAEAFWREH